MVFQSDDSLLLRNQIPDRDFCSRLPGQAVHWLAKAE